MKRRHLLTACAALVLLISCGPKRLGCHGRRYCEAPKSIEKNIAEQSVKRDA